jgi:hypothetical protein
MGNHTKARPKRTEIKLKPEVARQFRELLKLEKSMARFRRSRSASDLLGHMMHVYVYLNHPELKLENR